MVHIQWNLGRNLVTRSDPAKECQNALAEIQDKAVQLKWSNLELEVNYSLGKGLKKGVLLAQYRPNMTITDPKMS